MRPPVFDFFPQQRTGDPNFSGSLPFSPRLFSSGPACIQYILSPPFGLLRPPPSFKPSSTRGEVKDFSGHSQLRFWFLMRRYPARRPPPPAYLSWNSVPYRYTYLSPVNSASEKSVRSGFSAHPTADVLTQQATLLLTFLLVSRRIPLLFTHSSSLLFFLNKLPLGGSSFRVTPSA